MSTNVPMGPDEKVQYRQTGVTYLAGLKTATCNLLITDLRVILVRSQASGPIESMLGQKDILVDLPLEEVTGWTTGRFVVETTLELATRTSGVIKISGVKTDKVAPFLPAQV